MRIFTLKHYFKLKPLPIVLPLLLVSSLSTAVAPIESNFIMGMDMQSQRLNLYDGCPEGYVSCDDMLLVAPDLGRIALTDPAASQLNTVPYAVKLYPARTKHSLCKDGVTPCQFQGYIFSGEDISGFIDPLRNEITINSQWTTDGQTFSYVDHSDYLPLASQAGLIDTLYSDSDNALNTGYRVVLTDVTLIYGQNAATSFKKDQISWIKQRSKNCGADARHLPRTQAEKVCFIQSNSTRMQEYSSWLN